MSQKNYPHNPLEGEKPELNISLHDGTDDKVTIVIVHRDKPEYLNLLLQSIAMTSFNNNYEVVVVDNGSGRESQEFLDAIQDDVTLIRNKENLYWMAAANQGAEAAPKDTKYFIFMHCDVVVLSPTWIDVLVNVAEFQKAGIVGVELNQYYVQQQKVDYIPEWCMLMTRKCWDDIKPFPETIRQIGTGFVLTMISQHKGHKPQVMKNPICHHYKIFSLDINEYEVLVEEATEEIPKIMKEIQLAQQA